MQTPMQTEGRFAPGHGGSSVKNDGTWEYSGLPYTQGVTGSSPVPPTKITTCAERWWSWLPRRPVKPEVAGSSPVRSAIQTPMQTRMQTGAELR